MKKILISALFLLFLTSYGHAQAIQKFHEKFKNDSKFICISIESGLLKLLSNLEAGDKDSDEFLKAISGIEKINVYKINREESSFDAASFQALKKDITDEKFEELMRVKDGKSNLDFMIKENKGKVSDLIMMVDESDEFFLLTLSGNIDLATVSKLSDKIDIDGAKHLRKIDNEN